MFVYMVFRLATVNQFHAYWEASRCESGWLAVAGEVTAILGYEGSAEKAEKADLALMFIIFTFVLSGPRNKGDVALKERKEQRNQKN